MHALPNSLKKAALLEMIMVDTDLPGFVKRRASHTCAQQRIIAKLTIKDAFAFAARQAPVQGGLEDVGKKAIVVVGCEHRRIICALQSQQLLYLARTAVGKHWTVPLTVDASLSSPKHHRQGGLAGV